MREVDLSKKVKKHLFKCDKCGCYLSYNKLDCKRCRVYNVPLHMYSTNYIVSPPSAYN
jgi:hypothetical protein